MAPKVVEVDKSVIVRLEHAISNLWGELNTAVIHHQSRIDFETRLSACEEHFKAVLEGRASLEELQARITQVDEGLAMAMLQQAENEIPKIEKDSMMFHALENVRRELVERKISPHKARHVIKEVLRHHKG